jgi:protein involved in polysaccharide export with SLBB domain
VQPGASLNDVVAMAGGLTQQAYPFGAVFVRDSLRRQQKTNFDRAVDEIKITLTAQPLVSVSTAERSEMGARLAAVNSLVEQLRKRRIDGRLVLESSPSASAIPGGFLVENNDSLYVPPQSIAVGVYGMVNSAADFRYSTGMKIRDYVALAGGYSRLADKRHIFVVRANGTILGGRSARNAPALPGDLIFVPVDAQRGEFWARLRDITNTLFSGVATAAAVKVLSQ